MKQNIYLILILFLWGGVSIITGCQSNDEINPENICYTGEVYILKQASQPYSIVRIIAKDAKNGLQVEETITFEKEDFSPDLQIGSIIHFNILWYEKNNTDRFITFGHLEPGYWGIVKPCNK